VLRQPQEPPPPMTRGASGTSAMTSDSASSSPLFLSGFTAATPASLLWEALGMVKRKPLLAPPLE
jgi:hypothetical protein